MNDISPLRVGFIFEGPTEEETIPILVAKLLQRPVDAIPIPKQAPGFDDFRRPSPEQLRRGRRSPRWGMFKFYITTLLIKEVDAIVVVVDNDGQEPKYAKRWCLLSRKLPFDRYPIRLVDVSDLAGRCDEIHLALDVFKEHVTQVYQQGTTPVIIGVAVQMLEAWLLAQPHIVQGVLWEPISPKNRARCSNPEQIAHPKNEIIRPHNGGGDLSQRQAEQIGTHLEFAPGPIARACPSFARFARDVHILSTMAGCTK